MNTDVQQHIDWLDWLQRWDAQQEGYVPEREARFTAMFDALAALLPASFMALDLACGPGSISQRLLARFPGARAIAADIDPVMLAIGRGALGTVDGRLRWIEADLAAPDWLETLGDTQVDAVLSTTALHWLPPEPLARLYRDLGRLLRPGGLVLNGDHMAFGPSLPTFARLSGHVLEEQWTDAAFAARGIETSEQWWDALAVEPAVAPLLTERTRRLAGKQRQDSPPGFDVHVTALCEAGFREVGTIWQVAQLVQRVRATWQPGGVPLEQLRRPPVGQPSPAGGRVDIDQRRRGHRAAVGEEHRPPVRRPASSRGNSRPVPVCHTITSWAPPLRVTTARRFRRGACSAPRSCPGMSTPRPAGGGRYRPVRPDGRGVRARLLPALHGVVRLLPCVAGLVAVALLWKRDRVGA